MVTQTSASAALMGCITPDGSILIAVQLMEEPMWTSAPEVMVRTGTTTTMAVVIIAPSSSTAPVRCLSTSVVGAISPTPRLVASIIVLTIRSTIGTSTVRS